MGIPITFIKILKFPKSIDSNLRKTLCGHIQSEITCGKLPCNECPFSSDENMQAFIKAINKDNPES